MPLDPYVYGESFFGTSPKIDSSLVDHGCKDVQDGGGGGGGARDGG